MTTPDPNLVSCWDRARGDLPQADRSIRWALVLAALAWLAPVVLFNLLVG